MSKCLDILGDVVYCGAYDFPAIEISCYIFNDKSFSLMQNCSVSIQGPDDI